MTGHAVVHQSCQLFPGLQGVTQLLGIQRQLVKLRVGAVFPTPVGMNRMINNRKMRYRSVPHTRGDEPRRGMSLRAMLLCSPHPWG